MKWLLESGSREEIRSGLFITLYVSAARELVSPSKEMDPSKTRDLSSGMERERPPRMAAVTVPGAMYTFTAAAADDAPAMALTVTVYRLPALSE